MKLLVISLSFASLVFASCSSTCCKKPAAQTATTCPMKSGTCTAKAPVAVKKTTVVVKTTPAS